jgi:hypothetical protein
MYIIVLQLVSMKDKQPIKQSAAIQRMRELSQENIPFSFGFITCNTNHEVSKGYRVVSKGILRNGLRADKSSKADSLIAYIDYDDKNEDKNRFFYYPLLMMFNGQKVQP